MKNPAAFPMTIGTQVQAGMTLRDYFAGQAIRGLCHNNGDDFVAKAAYALADAMLKVRDNK